MNMARVVNVARVQLTTWKHAFGWPVVILGISFAFNVAFFASMGDNIEEPITWGVVSIYIFQIIMCSQMMAQNFSFAVGLNVTRRTFFAAASLVIALQSVAFSVLLYGLAILEQLSGGWGLRLTYFTALPLNQTYSPTSIVVYLVPMLVCSYGGLFLGVVGKRWGTNGVLTVMTGSVVVIGAAAVAITWLDGWRPIGSWLTDQPGLALVAGWTLLPLVVLVAGAYGLTRRAVP